ncbi:H/ACA snoRNP pseudouridylase subunit [Hamiltosporidium tvaerminnensis]|nr:H/ACA snoRNP pseudouridylase subunit [Hamiltosporidium tvaerminnensis]
MIKYKNKKDNKPCTKDDIEELGSFKHKCEDLIIISVTNANIPYPNSMVFSKKLEQIGKIDEVLGSFDDVYVSIAPTDNKTEKLKEGTVFYCDKRKLMPKSRFISRTDTEKIKEEKDKRKNNDSYKNRNSSFNSKEGGGYRNKTNDSYKNRNSSFNNKE